MASDPIGRVFLLAAIVIFLYFFAQPDRSIRILSYGKYSKTDIDSRIVLITRTIAILAALWGLFYLGRLFR